MIITSKDNTACDSFTEQVKNMLVCQAGRYNFCLWFVPGNSFFQTELLVFRNWEANNRGELF